MRKKPQKAKEYRVMREMNNKNTINVLAPSVNRIFQIVDYEDSRIHEELAKLDSGKLVKLKLKPAGRRASVWRACWPEDVESVVPTQ